VTISTPKNSVQSSGGPGQADFEVVRRGYDRDQVDAQLRELRDRLNAAEAARQAAEKRARDGEADKRSSRSSDAPAQESFGFRAEKILRLAEHEAADVRSRAASEATGLVEQARADAERHRHEVEQSLIVRSAELDQEAAQRNVAIQEREKQAAATLAAAREDAARIADDARHAADALVSEAQNRAEELRHRSDQEMRRRRDSADHELRRVTGLHEGVRGEMGRLHGLLVSELGGTNGQSRSKADAGSRS
jgi:cell division septum initiation protein DivIVA